ncbi:MAG: tRNA preQ1(34) S-adenosylmethionine ribosyltransferase-isomerase QueA [Acetobacteraceae bacterium]|nr:tRNA preQ1(34) S-adenosylmethionine ribosyltransferase-isomerase QueA [Acetobacteraceae bacterium]
MGTKLADFDYLLPPELIAQEPLPERDASRLLVLHRDTGAIEHRAFPDLLEYLRPGDSLLLNDTAVMRARLVGTRAGTGGRMEALLLRELEPGRWEALVRPARKARVGCEIELSPGGPRLRVEGVLPEGRCVARLLASGAEAPEAVLERWGRVPLPPYIKKPLADPDRYQTVYARERGSAAGPTAGFHFTPGLLGRVEQMGVRVAFVTLHIGLATFRPIRAEDVEDHVMHEEFYRVGPEAAEAVNAARRQGGRVVAVGTTTVRALESAAGPEGVSPREGWTRLFIYPGWRFRVVDALLTNFHLPRSSLLLLVAALAGREPVLRAYREAVERRYRFYSFGDAMLIL